MKKHRARAAALIARIEADPFTSGLLFAAVITTILFFPIGGR